MQHESHIAGEHLTLQVLEGVFQIGLALLQGGAEALLFGQDELALQFAILHDLWVDISHEPHDLIHILIQEGAVNADEMGLHDGPTQQTAQHIPAALIGRQDTVSYHESDRPRVVSHDAQSQVSLTVFAIGDPCQALPYRDEAAQDICLVVGLHALHDGGDALQAHARVDVLLRQLLQGAVFLAVILGKNAVPVLQEAIAITAGGAIRATATEFRTLVIVELRARPTGTGGSSAPKVIIFAQLGDMAFWHSQGLPDLDGLIVIFEHSEIEPLQRKPQHVHREIQGPLTHLVLEVLAEGEIAQHLEEAQVPPCGTNDVYVIGADTLLHGGGADVRLFQLLLL